MKRITRISMNFAMGFALTLGTAACGKSGGGAAQDRVQDKVTTSDIQAAVMNITDNVIVPVYADLNQKALELHQAALKLQSEPTQENLEAAQAAWKAARVPWESSEAFLFGPVESLAVDPHIDSWPLSKDDLDAILKGQTSITAEFVRGLGTDVQGFHTVEYLLFGEGIHSNTKSIRDLTHAQRNYLVASSEVLHDYTERLHVAWTKHHNPDDAGSPGYASVFKNPNPDNSSYPSLSSCLQELTSAIIGIANEVGQGKLQRPMGGDISKADPSRVESQFSWNSLADFQDNVRSILYIYTGDYKDNKGAGLDDLVKATNPALDAKILAQIQNSLDKIAAIAGPENISFSQAISRPEGRDRVNAASAALSELEATFQNEVLPLMK